MSTTTDAATHSRRKLQYRPCSRRQLRTHTPLSKATPAGLRARSLARTADECSLPVGTVPRGSGRLRAASSWPLSKATPAELVARSLAQTAGGSTASHDNSARLWFLLPAGVPPPEWCADFLVWLGGKRINRDGQIETLSGDESLKVEAQLRPHMNEDTDYAQRCAGDC